VPTPEKRSWHTIDERAQAMHRELRAMGMPRVNLFLVGPRSVTQDLLELLLPDLHAPITTWFRGERLTLSPPAGSGTMIFYEVGALGYDDQHRLLEHLASDSARPRIISTSSTALWPRFHAGSFDDTLYYRLNHIYLDLSGPASRPL
jgi:transcriptional regulator of acetoin/glycerol metabolism